MKALTLLTLLTLTAFSDVKLMISDKISLKSVSRVELAKVFLKQSNKLGNITVIPVDNKDAYNEFYKKVVKKTPKQIKAYWMKEIYRGDKQPPKKLSTAQIKKAMKKNPKIISYTKSKTGGILISIK